MIDNTGLLNFTAYDVRAWNPERVVITTGRGQESRTL
jgi:hypothetical protein